MPQALPVFNWHTVSRASRPHPASEHRESGEAEMEGGQVRSFCCVCGSLEMGTCDSGVCLYSTKARSGRQQYGDVDERVTAVLAIIRGLTDDKFAQSGY